MKRSRSIRLVLIGTLSAGTLASCTPNPRSAPVSAENVYTNNYFLPGAGYYHAPFRAWFPMPYNHYEPSTRQYFFGGQWASAPHQSITNISAPPAEAAAQAQAQRTDVARGGFGSTSHTHWIHS